jgi:hypothetical protein
MAYRAYRRDLVDINSDAAASFFLGSAVAGIVLLGAALVYWRFIF